MNCHHDFVIRFITGILIVNSDFRVGTKILIDNVAFCFFSVSKMLILSRKNKEERVDSTNNNFWWSKVDSTSDLNTGKSALVD